MAAEQTRCESYSRNRIHYYVIHPTPWNAIHFLFSSVAKKKMSWIKYMQLFRFSVRMKLAMCAGDYVEHARDSQFDANKTGNKL